MFMADEDTYLGHRINKYGRQTTKDKVHAIKKTGQITCVNSPGVIKCLHSGMMVVAPDKTQMNKQSGLKLQSYPQISGNGQDR